MVSTILSSKLEQIYGRQLVQRVTMPRGTSQPTAAAAAVPKVVIAL